MSTESTGLIHVPISIGELADKVTILEIKSERLGDASQRDNVNTELRLLREVMDRLKLSEAVRNSLETLREINLELWNVEDEIRSCDAAGDFGPRFVELARAVYHHNDRRAAVKRSINILSGSALVEEKSYADRG